MNDYSNYELVVRKRVCSIIEKMLRYLGYDFVHDRYKEIIYSEEPYISKQEEYIKGLYDGFMYLLNNKKSTVNKNLFLKFFYLIGTKVDEYKLNKLISYYVSIENKIPVLKAIDYMHYIYSNFKDIKDILLISFMVFNFILNKHGIPCIQIVRRHINDFIKYLDEYEIVPDNLINLIYEIIKESKYLDKSYYPNLIDHKKEDIILGILEEKDYLKSKGIEGIILYGSFVKGNNRFDSDIDLLARINEDISYLKKMNLIEEIKSYLTKKFKRFVDIEQIGSLINEELILELTEYKKIY